MHRTFNWAFVSVLRYISSVVPSFDIGNSLQCRPTVNWRGGPLNVGAITFLPFCGCVPLLQCLYCSIDLDP